MIHITIPLIPTGQQRPRFAKGGFAYKHKTQTTREAQLLSYLVEHAPPKPSEKPISLYVTAVFPVPKSWSKSKTAAALAGEIMHDKTPDASNIIKQIEDVMQGMFFVNDKQICTVAATKLYGIHPRWDIWVNEL